MTHLPSDFPENRRFSWNSFIQARNARILFFSPHAFSFLIDILLSWVKAKTFSTCQPLTSCMSEINKKKKITCDSHKSCLSPRIRPTTDVCGSSERLTTGSRMDVRPVAPVVYDLISFLSDSGCSAKQSNSLKRAAAERTSPMNLSSD